MSQAAGRRGELRGVRAASAGVQLQGVLDQLFYYPGPLGAEVGPNGVALRVWAPTAQQVGSTFLISSSCVMALRAYLERGRGPWAGRLSGAISVQPRSVSLRVPGTAGVID